MALTTPNMSLKTWDQLNDLYSHTDLRSNFVAIDNHDHSTGKGLQIGSAGIANNAITTAQVQDASITTPKLGAGVVSDAKLASPNNGAYKHLLQAGGMIGSTVAIGTYVFLATANPTLSGATTGGAVPTGLYYNSADHDIVGLTTKLRLRGYLNTNAVAPTSTFTVGLYPLTVAGSGTYLPTVGAVVAGSTLVQAAPGAITAFNLASVDFTPPANGAYVFGVAISSSNTAASSLTSISLRLQVRNV